MTREWGDDLLDRIADDTMIEETADEKNMTASEYRAWCDEQNDEAAISRMESDQ